MTRKNITITMVMGVVLIGLAAGTFLLYTDNKNDQAEIKQELSSSKAVKKESKPAPKNVATSNAPAEGGTYQAYNPENLSNAGDRERILFFHAPWCPQCRKLDADINAKGAPEGIAIYKIDYDSNQSLRTKYGVTQQTTVVHVDAEGNKIKSFLPYSDPSLENALNGLGL